MESLLFNQEPLTLNIPALLNLRMMNSASVPQAQGMQRNNHKKINDNKEVAWL